MTSLEKIKQLREQLFQKSEEEKEKEFEMFLKDTTVNKVKCEDMFEILKVIRGR